MLPSDKPYLKTGIFELAKNRIVWLTVLMLSSMITGSILTYYEAAFAALPLLVSFVPMLTGTGGNAGSQSSTDYYPCYDHWRCETHGYSEGNLEGNPGSGSSGHHPGRDSILFA